MTIWRAIRTGKAHDCHLGRFTRHLRPNVLQETIFCRKLILRQKEKRMKTLRLLILSTIFCLMAFVLGCGQSPQQTQAADTVKTTSQLDTILKRGTIKVGFDTFKPWAMKDKTAISSALKSKSPASWPRTSASKWNSFRPNGPASFRPCSPANSTSSSAAWASHHSAISR